MARELTDPALELLDEFTAAWARGESPDPRQLVARADPEEQRELSHLIDRFLAGQARREPTAKSLAYVQVIAGLAADPVVDDAPLLEARVRLGLKRDTVVTGLREALGLDASADSKLRRYYHRLESGLLDTSRVSEKVWTALEAILQWRGDATHQQPLAATANAFFRSADASAAPGAVAAAALGFDPDAEPVEWAAVDELFLGPKPTDHVPTGE